MLDNLATNQCLDNSFAYNKKLECWSTALCAGCFDNDNTSLDTSFQRRVDSTKQLNQSDILEETELQALHQVTAGALFGGEDNKLEAIREDHLEHLRTHRTISFQRDDSELHISLLENDESDEERQDGKGVHGLNRSISELVNEQCFGETKIRLDAHHSVRIVVMPKVAAKETPKEVPQSLGGLNRFILECTEMSRDMALCCDFSQIRKEIREEGILSLTKNWDCIMCDGLPDNACYDCYQH